MRRLLTALGLVLVMSSATVASAAAVAPSRGVEAPGRILGVVPVLDQARGGHHPGGHTNNLSYHGGPVMQAGNRTYLIFWSDGSYTFDSTYISTIERYFNDVASAANSTTNVYYSDTQYTDAQGASITDKSTYGGAYLDQNPYPKSGCRDKATKICLSDAQLQTEIQAAMSENGWTAIDSNGVQSLFFIFTPQGVGSCAGSSCAYTNYCAYHSWIGSGSDAILYANQPYAAQGWKIYTCDSGQHPNGTDADATLNVVSHEHNEAITDEQGNAWYDGSGAENGDKCAWNFGTAIDTTQYGSYNQVINNHPYYLQQEWSNASPGCVLQGI